MAASTLVALPIDCPVLLHPKDFHRRRLDRRHQGLKTPLPPTLNLTSSHSSTELYTLEFMAVRCVAKNVTQCSPAFTKLA
jgi:hypothetical protein